MSDSKLAILGTGTIGGAIATGVVGAGCYQAGEIVLTRGPSGMTCLDREGQTTEVPTLRAEVFDVQGAGDTSIATLALCRAAGTSLVDACVVANAAAGVAVGKTGTAAVDQLELHQQLARAIAAFEGTL